VVAIEADAAILRLIREALATGGMVCRPASTAEAGLALIGASRPDLVLVNTVPDGFEVCRAIRATWEADELPVVLLAGRDDLSSLEAAYASGANELLDLPLNAARLPLRLRHVLQASREAWARRQSEAALRERVDWAHQQFNLANEGILVHTLTGRMLEMNDAFARMHGYTTEAMLAMNLRDLNEPGTFRKHPDRLARILAGEATTFEVRHVHKDGHVLPLEVSASVLARGEETVLITFHREITERVRAQEERERLQTQLNQAQKMESLGVLASGIAHDMNNVLGAILGMASAHLEAHAEGSPTRRAFDTISQAATRGGMAVKSLLRFAHQTPTEVRELDMNELLREEIRLLERTTLSKVRLELDLAADLWPIRGEVSTLANTIMNLCVNAVDAMQGQGTLTLRTRNAGEGGIEVRVEDSGSGMSREVLEKALDPFFTTKAAGTGLGLSMVYSTVKAHRGKLDIRSEPGKGTCVRMCFPACLSSGEPSRAAGPDGVQARGGALRILLVDDDDLVRGSMEEILGVLAHTFTSAACGEQALLSLEQGLAADLVILDLNMPGLGGKGTLVRLRASYPDLPVLLVTGQADQAALDLVAAHPQVALLSKPFKLRDLEERLARYAT